MICRILALGFVSITINIVKVMEYLINVSLPSSDIEGCSFAVAVRGDNCLQCVNGVASDLEVLKEVVREVLTYVRVTLKETLDIAEEVTIFFLVGERAEYETHFNIT
jgi:hypothetical protein